MPEPNTYVDNNGIRRLVLTYTIADWSKILSNKEKEEAKYVHGTCAIEGNSMSFHEVIELLFSEKYPCNYPKIPAYHYPTINCHRCGSHSFAFLEGFLYCADCKKKHNENGTICTEQATLEGLF